MESIKGWADDLVDLGNESEETETDGNVAHASDETEIDGTEFDDWYGNRYSNTITVPKDEDVPF
jgi:hypothetical protein